MRTKRRGQRFGEFFNQETYASPRRGSKNRSAAPSICVRLTDYNLDLAFNSLDAQRQACIKGCALEGLRAPSVPILEAINHSRHNTFMTAPVTTPKKIDPFFEVVPNPEWNACVGVQGNPLNYVDGYLEAARELVAAVIDKRQHRSRDTLAMPILYNCRHGLELSLKSTIDRLHRLAMIAPILKPVDHDILSNWQHLCNARIGDSQIVQIVSELEPFVTSLSGIDKDGQELRFATRTDGRKSLGGIAVVNLRLIRHSIDEMSVILKRLTNRLFVLEDERPTGTHTKECSRADLESIAQVLGAHATWRDPMFDEKKAEVMKRFDLSSRKFCAAVSAIRKSRPLAAMVGLESELLHLDDDKAVAALEFWANAEPEEVQGPIYFGSYDWDKFAESAQMTRKLVESVLKLLTLEEVADLEVLYYLGCGIYRGEHYEKNVHDTIAQYCGAVQHRGAGARWELVNHIISKKRLFEMVIEGALAVGRPSLADKLRRIRPV